MIGPPPGSGGPALELRGVTFRYPAVRRAVLEGVDLVVAPGEIVGVTGPNEAGKSTLCRLITGVWPPASGSVRLDGAEVHMWERADFGRHVGYLPQEVGLFAGTVRDNIARMAAAPDEAVVAAAQLAGCEQAVGAAGRRLRSLEPVVVEPHAVVLGEERAVVAGQRGAERFLGLLEGTVRGRPAVLVNEVETGHHGPAPAIAGACPNRSLPAPAAAPAPHDHCRGTFTIGISPT